MKRIAVISAILENPSETQQKFNEIISNFKGIVKGRMGIPFDKDNMAVISIIVTSDADEINSLTGKLGSLKNVKVKTAISNKTIEE